VLTRRAFHSLAVAAIAATVAFSGCKKETASNTSGGDAAAKTRKVFAIPAGQKPKLAFVTNNASDFWKIAAAGVEKFKSETGVQVDMKIPASNSVAEQNGILEDLLSQGYNGIAISVISPDEQTRQIDKACEKTNVITHDSDAPKSNRLLYIGTNNYEAGKVLGNEIVKLLPNGGKIAVFVGTFGADNAKQRLAGIEDAIKGKNIEIVEKREDQTDRAMARSNVETVLNARADVNMVVGLWSYNGPAIAAALTGSGKKGKVKAAVFDEEEGTLDGIENDVIDVTCVQRPYEMGYQSSKWMHDLAARGDAAVTKIPADKAVDTGVQVINKSNVGKFREDLRKLTK